MPAPPYDVSNISGSSCVGYACGVIQGAGGLPPLNPDLPFVPVWPGEGQPQPGYTGELPPVELPNAPPAPQVDNSLPILEPDS